RRVGEVIRRLRPEIFLTLSHEIAPVVGEYERTSTAALNARLGPVVLGYLENLRRRLSENGFAGRLLVAQAYGGLLPVEEAGTRPVGMIGSGPVSAGSYPGPICYAHGGDEPTITDIDAILGYLNPAYFLGGRAELDIDKARRLFTEHVAAPLGLETVEAAAAMYKLANSLFYDL